MVLLAVGIYLVIRNKPAFVRFAAGCLPAVVLVGIYNTYYLGAPWEFGQGITGRAVALRMTGSQELWQTPLWEGLAGLLISPSRGLFVYSPVLAFALWGVFLAWRRPGLAILRPFSLAAAVILIIQSKWFCWWGGYSFGYRIILDITVLLIPFLAVTMDELFRRKTLLAAFAVLLACSLLVQIVGVFADDASGWNARTGYLVQVDPSAAPQIMVDKADAEALASQHPSAKTARIVMEVDSPEFRHRLWQLRDSQLVYLLSNFRQCRQNKRAVMEYKLANPGAW